MEVDWLAAIVANVSQLAVSPMMSSNYLNEIIVFNLMEIFYNYGLITDGPML